MSDRLIDSMCLTWRHDFGLTKTDALSSGIADGEREQLRRQMQQLLTHHGHEIAARFTAAQPPAQAGAEVWHPMETAPKDGTEVILRNVSWNRALAHYMPGGHCIEDHPPIDAGWYFWNGRIHDVFTSPVQWRSIVQQDQPEPSPDTEQQRRDAELALDLLETLFSEWEEGTPCYESEDGDGAFLGNAFRLDDETFKGCVDLLNRRRPRAAIEAEGKV